jgi:hypothetical protein
MRARVLGRSSVQVKRGLGHEVARLAICLQCGGVRAAWTAVAALGAMFAGQSAAAQQEIPSRPSASAAAALGAGVFGASPAATLDIGMDVAAEHYAMGFGARLRWVMDEGFRDTDWDERSEWSGLLRYLTYVREHERVTATVAAGELGSATLGQGALIRGYASGLHVDHRHLGVELAVAGQRAGGELIIDDLVAPRIAGTRGHWHALGPRTRIELGVSLAADMSAPHGQGMTAIVPMAAVDGRAEVRDQRMSGAVHAQIAAISTMAAGLHLGLSGSMNVAGSARVTVRGEGHLGTDRYIPGWIGPLYEVDRRQLGQDMAGAALTQLEVARAGGLGGLGALAELEVQAPGLGELALSYARRAGLADQVVARVTAPHARAVQAGLWLAAEVDDTTGPRTWVVAAEVRARIRGRFFAAAEAARLVRDQDAALAPLWHAGAAIGADLDM